MSFLRPVAIGIAASVLVVGVTTAQEKKIKRSDLPPAVEKAVAEASKGATVKGFSKETENGKTTYEAEMVVNRHTKDLEFEADGTVAEVEEEVALDSLPADVKTGLNAKAAGAKILKVESLTKKGKLVAYEAKIETAGKRHEIQVGPDGKPLDHEE